LRLRPLEHLPRALAEILAASAADRGELGELGPECPLDRVGTGPELGKEGADDTLTLLDQGGEQVLGLDRLVALLLRQRLGGLQRFLCLDRELVQPHSRFTPPRPPRGARRRASAAVARLALPLIRARVVSALRL